MRRDRHRRHRYTPAPERLEGRSLLTAAALNLPSAYGLQPVPADFDADGMVDPALYRKANGQWVRGLSGSGTDVREQGYGSLYVPAVADYDGDGRADPGLFNPATRRWVVPAGSDGRMIHRLVAWGNPEDLPVPADYDGDGKAELAVWRPATGRWSIRRGTASRDLVGLPWGLPGDIPVPADYDGDGKVDLGVWRPSTGRWYVRPAAESGPAIVHDTWWGLPGDIPVPADYNGDGKAELAVWRPSNGRWYVRSAAAANPPAYSQTFWWGLPGDIPAPGDYDGDGKADAAIWRPDTDQWWIRASTAGMSERSLPHVPDPAPINSAGWWQRHQEVLDLARVQEPDVVFLGDSITEGWGDPAHQAPGRSTWLERFAGWKVANLGVSSDTSESLLWRLEQGLLATKPRAAVLMIGVNDLMLDRSPRAITASVRAVLEEIRRQSPGTRVLLMGVLPTGRAADAPLRGRIRQLNAQLETLSDGYDVRFVDIGSRLLAADGSLPPGVAPDGLHLAAPGYQAWAEAIVGPLRAILDTSAAGLVPVPADYDGDGLTDRGVWDAASGRWWAWSTATDTALIEGLGWGLPGDIPVPADYDGDGRAELAVFRPTLGRWYLMGGQVGGILELPWGLPGDLPVPADFDGDGAADLALWRPGTGRWYVRTLGDPLPLIDGVWWGLPGDVPVAADHDGDGAADLAVWRPGSGRFHIWPSNGTPRYDVAWGLAGDIPSAADLDGDGMADLTVFRPAEGRFYIRHSASPTSATFDLGQAGDVPLPADYLGRGRAGFAVYQRVRRRWLVAYGDDPASTREWIIPAL
jgi:lysophospholipase L1-like esterase